ncbi:hypothetical protein [Geodermatophilus sp. SYSU D00766]
MTECEEKNRVTKGSMIRETVVKHCEPCGRDRSFLPGVICEEDRTKQRRISSECEHTLVDDVYVVTSIGESTRADL